MRDIDPEVLSRLAQYMSPEIVLGLASDLIRIPSFTTEGQVQAVDALEGFFRRAGVKTHRQVVDAFGVNLIAHLPAVSNDPGLLYNGHLDTVPPSSAMPFPPFDPTIVDGQMWGRGAADMKGGIAAMACALAAIRRAGILLKRPVSLAAVACEEQGNRGTWALVQNGVQAAFAVVGEATGLDLVMAHKGVDRYKVIVEGRAAHESTPERGVNAIVHAATVIGALDRELFPRARQQTHPVLGTATYNIGTIQGGTSRNSVPDQCMFQIGKRWLPGDSPDAIRAEIESIVQSVPGRARVRVEHEPVIEMIPHPPLELDPDHPDAQMLADTVCRVTGRRPALRPMAAFTDAALLNGAGIPTLICGPGDVSLAHCDEERIEISEVMAAAWIFAQFAVRMCANELHIWET